MADRFHGRRQAERNLDPVSSTIDANLTPTVRREPRQAVSAHFVIGVLWLTYWFTNSYIWIADVAPFLDYYVFTGFFLVYYFVFRPNRLLQFVMHPMLWVWLMLTIIPVAIYFLGGAPRTYHGWDDMRSRIVFFSLLGSMAFVLWDDDGPRVLRRAATVSLYIALLTFFGELFVHNPYARSVGRSAGFYADSNIAGNTLLVLLLLSQDLRKQSMRSLILVGITLLGVITTLSRSAMALGLLIAGAHLFIPQGRGTLQFTTRLAIAAGGMIAIAVVLAISIALFDVDTSEGWRIVSVLTFDTSDNSSQSRVEAFLFSLDRFFEFFWTGRGPGADRYYGVFAHNTYLTLGYNYGIFALIIYVLLLSQGFFKVLRFGLQRSLTVVVLTTQIALYSLLDHTMHQRSITAILFAALMTNAIISPKEETASSESAALPERHPMVDYEVS